MRLLRVTLLSLLVYGVGAVAGFSSEVAIKLSGPGAVNDSTIKAGENVSFDIYMKNDQEFKGFSMGFKFGSPDIKAFVHVGDSAGANERGDVKAYNGFEGSEIWDLGGLYVVDRNWDGSFPDVIGFGGVCVKNVYEPHDWERKISISAQFDQPGTVVVDSSFFPPTGYWMFALPKHEPVWHGPYNFQVVK